MHNNLCFAGNPALRDLVLLAGSSTETSLGFGRLRDVKQIISICTERAGGFHL